MQLIFLRDLVRLTDLAVLYADETGCTDAEAADVVYTTWLARPDFQVFLNRGGHRADEAQNENERGEWLCEFCNFNWWLDEDTGAFPKNRTAHLFGYAADDVLVRRSDAELCQELAACAAGAPSADDPPHVRPARRAYAGSIDVVAQADLISEMRRHSEALERAESARMRDVVHAGFARIREATRRGEALAAQPRSDEAQLRRVLVGPVQEDAILKWLREHGHDPLKMPRAPSGNKAWPLREQCRADLGLTKDQCLNAWKRLRADGRLKDE